VTAGAPARAASRVTLAAQVGRAGERIFIDEKPDHYAFAGDAEKMTGAEAMAKFGVGES